MKTDWNDMKDEDLAAVIRRKLESDANWIRRALIALLSQQTEAEKMNPNSVHESNGRGFSPQDQPFLTSLAVQVTKGITLSERQLVWCRKLLPKYTNQLVRISRERSLEKYIEENSGEFIPTYYFSDFEIHNDLRKMIAISGNLGIDVKEIPSAIVVTNPSSSEILRFDLIEKFRSSDEQRVEAVLYRDEIHGKTWDMTIIIGPPDEPTRDPLAWTVGPLAKNQKKPAELDW